MGQHDPSPAVVPARGSVCREASLVHFPPDGIAMRQHAADTTHDTLLQATQGAYGNTGP
jgi:hypothetical protein